MIERYLPVFLQELIFITRNQRMSQANNQVRPKFLLNFLKDSS